MLRYHTALLKVYDTINRHVLYHYHNLTFSNGKVAIFLLTVIMVYSQRMTAYHGGALDDRRSIWMFFGVIALAIVNLIGWGRFNYILASQGYLSEEFVANWVAARALIVEGESPYQPEITQTILSTLDTAVARDIDRVPQFTSPIYTIVIFLPIAFIADLIIAQAVWMTILQVVLIASILIAVHISPTKPSRLVYSFLVFTTLISFHVILPIYHGSTIVVAGLFLLLSLLSIRNGREEIGGVMLGLATIQLPYLVLPILLILFWTTGHRQRLFFLWFLGILILLVVLGVFLVPEWPQQYLKILFRYALYYPASSPGAAFRSYWPGIGTLLARLLTIVTTAVLLFEWWIARKGDFNFLYWAVGFTLTIGFWIGLPALPNNLILLLLPLVLCISAWSERWGRAGSAIAIICLTVVLIWEWWLAFGNINSLRQVDALRLLIPLPLICLVGLYWVRSVIVRPKRLVDRLRTGENV